MILLGRLALYGPGAARLHEEIILVTAAWKEAERGTKPLKPFGTVREEATLDQLDQAFRASEISGSHTSPSGSADGRRRMPPIWNPSCSVAPKLRRPRRSNNCLPWARPRRNRFSACWKISARGSPKADAEPDDRQLSFLPDVEAEAEQRRRDRRHWKVKLERLTTEIGREPERVRRSYSVAADRLETIGLVYLWPETN